MRILTHIPQVTDRITSARVRAAPAQALRAVFARIGQALMAADRLTKQAQGHASAPADGPPSAAAQPGPGHDAAQAPAGPARPRWRSLDQTGNVRLLSAEDRAGDLAAHPPAETPAAVAEPAPTGMAGAHLSDPAPVSDQDAGLGSPPDAELPVRDYDSLSLPSLRARLRGLDAAQVRILADYERARGGRADVVAMFERRIAKLAAGE